MDLEAAVQKTVNADVDLGRKLERERIIKLLEDETWHAVWYPPQERYATKPFEELVTSHRENCIGCHLIALIKGEN